MHIGHKKRADFCKVNLTLILEIEHSHAFCFLWDYVRCQDIVALVSYTLSGLLIDILGVVQKCVFIIIV